MKIREIVAYLCARRYLPIIFVELLANMLIGQSYNHPGVRLSSISVDETGELLVVCNFERIKGKSYLQIKMLCMNYT